MNYAVIFTYSFDGETAVYLFPDEESAKQFLKDSFEEELRIDTEENEWGSAGYIDADGWYAQIRTHFEDHVDKTEMRIGCIYN